MSNRTFRITFDVAIRDLPERISAEAAAAMIDSMIYCATQGKYSRIAIGNYDLVDEITDPEQDAADNYERRETEKGREAALGA